MCLITDYLKPKKAKEDIVCYKVVKSVDGELFSPLYPTPVTMGESLKAVGKFPELSIFQRIKKRVSRTGLCVGEGCIHTCRTIEDAAAMAYILTYDENDKELDILECRIKAGTKYYSGFTWVYKAAYGYASESVEVGYPVRLEDKAKQNTNIK